MMSFEDTHKCKKKMKSDQATPTSHTHQTRPPVTLTRHVHQSHPPDTPTSHTHQTHPPVTPTRHTQSSNAACPTFGTLDEVRSEGHILLPYSTTRSSGEWSPGPSLSPPPRDPPLSSSHVNRRASVISQKGLKSSNITLSWRQTQSVPLQLRAKQHSTTRQHWMFGGTLLVWYTSNTSVHNET